MSEILVMEVKELFPQKVLLTIEKRWKRAGNLLFEGC